MKLSRYAPLSYNVFGGNKTEVGEFPWMVYFSLFIFIYFTNIFIYFNKLYLFCENRPPLVIVMSSMKLPIDVVEQLFQIILY